MITVTPEIFLKNYPEGEDPDAFEKILRHEMAHRLHVRILNGNEDLMGPNWFFEGFATLLADQFPEQTGEISSQEIKAVFQSQQRGSYRTYNQMIKYFMKKSDLPTLVSRAGKPDFQLWLERLID